MDDHMATILLSEQYFQLIQQAEFDFKAKPITIYEPRYFYFEQT